MKLDWMKEVDWKEGLTEDLHLVLSVCGEGTVLALLEHLAGHHLFVSSAPIKEAQRKYIKKFSSRKSTKKLAFETGASERFVQRVLLEKDDDQD